jgi:hypothetical protein
LDKLDHRDDAEAWQDLFRCRPQILERRRNVAQGARLAHQEEQVDLVDERALGRK